MKKLRTRRSFFACPHFLREYRKTPRRGVLRKAFLYAAFFMTKNSSYSCVPPIQPFGASIERSEPVPVRFSGVRAAFRDGCDFPYPER
jgi:hypothetical protein